MSKRFKISAADIRPIVKGYGACFATDRIVVDGERVGYMYREDPGYGSDSGWRFTAGNESDEYMDDPHNHGVYDVNTIANYDPDIVQFLDAPAGSQFVRWPPGSPLAPDPGTS